MLDFELDLEFFKTTNLYVAEDRAVFCLWDRLKEPLDDLSRGTYFQ
jgi:hypothetical protein